MKQIILLCCFTSYFVALAQVGIGTITPDDDLDVVGDTQVSGFLRVGNPAIPQIVSNTGIQLFTMGGAAYYSGFTQNGCGTIWSGTQTGSSTSDTAIIQYDNVGSRGNQNLVSPHIWVPSIANSITVEISHFCTLENGFDGVFLEYSTNDGLSWNGIPAANFFIGGYTGLVAGSNATCNGDLNTNAWTGIQNNMVTALSLNLTNTWIQFRFVGTEDFSVGSGEYNLLNFTVFTDDITGGSGGAFAGGNIYAENNIYAGSNVALGDLAEYFPVKGPAIKGDIISYVKGNNHHFSISTKENDEKIIGIYSSNPTLTLNDPNSGIPVALQGRVPVNIVGASVKKGDYLTSSNIPGKAMKANGSCYTIGRALETFKGGNGTITCLVETGWKNLNTNTTNLVISSQNIFPAHKKNMRITNPYITKDAQIFVSFKGNTGSHHWVKNITEGAFEINLANITATSVPFDYLIQNAKEINDRKSTPTKDLIDDRKPYLTTSKIPSIINSSSPPLVSDPKESYVWSIASGLIINKN
jgi:hypothetical protein